MAIRVKRLTDFLCEYHDAVDWLAEYTTRKRAFASRFGEYLRVLELIIPKIENGETLTPEESSQFAVSHEGAEDLVDIHIGLRGYTDNQILSENLARLPRGPSYPDATTADGSRSITFELALASRFARHGADVFLAARGGADIRIRVQEVEFVFECKRPLTGDAFRRNYESANSQLRCRFTHNETAVGVIAISIGHALTTGVHETRMFLNAEDEKSINDFAIGRQEALRPAFDQFTALLAEQNRISPNLGGRIVDFRFLARDRSTGRYLQVSDMEIVGYGDAVSPLHLLYEIAQ